MSKKKTPTRKFVTILYKKHTGGLRLKFHFPKAHGFKLTSHPGGWILYEFENTFYVQFMSMQSGRVSWVVCHSPIDSPISVYSGKVRVATDTGPGHWSYDAVEVELNKAFAKLTSEWRDEFLPPSK